MILHTIKHGDKYTQQPQKRTSGTSTLDDGTKQTIRCDNNSRKFEIRKKDYRITVSIQIICAT